MTDKSQNLYAGGRSNCGEHFTFAAKLEIEVLRQETGGKSQEERVRRKEQKEVFLQI
ncbi:hypothetical protein [Microcoleus vaginatus]|uniref:hypothetical protein n=1 Tax=Microcoleus vaginatus TaxID=119532 RepID=UPI0032A74903